MTPDQKLVFNRQKSAVVVGERNEEILDKEKCPRRQKCIWATLRKGEVNDCSKCDVCVKKSALSSSMTHQNNKRVNAKATMKTSPIPARTGTVWLPEEDTHLGHLITLHWLSLQTSAVTNRASPPPLWPAAPRSSSSSPVGSRPGRGRVQNATPPWRQ